MPMRDMRKTFKAMTDRRTNRPIASSAQHQDRAKEPRHQRRVNGEEMRSKKIDEERSPQLAHGNADEQRGGGHGFRLAEVPNALVYGEERDRRQTHSAERHAESQEIDRASQPIPHIHRSIDRSSHQFQPDRGCANPRIAGPYCSTRGISLVEPVVRIFNGVVDRAMSRCANHSGHSAAGCADDVKNNISSSRVRRSPSQDSHNVRISCYPPWIVRCR